MPTKKTVKPKRSTAAKPKKSAAKVKKGDAYECRVCGYRIVVDEVCGCVEEHVYVCCDKPMKKKRG